MSLNFDAQINLDVAPFLSGIERAKGAVKSLNAELTALASRKVTVNVAVATAGANAAAAVSGAAQSALKQRQASSNTLMREVQSTRELNNEREEGIRSLARERYALYDVAAAYQMVSTAAFAGISAMAGSAIQYERAFANVDRTTEFTSAKIGEAARVMRYELTQIASEIPVAFGKITDIATIGNQLGIAQGQLTDFTETVAKFSATTGMTAESTAMGLGRAVELLSDETSKVDFNKFASSIAYAGVKAVATEEQIVSVTKEIATTAKMAKFGAADVVGLATALSSVGVAPEAARGSIIRTFAGINKAISDGGNALKAYADISGMSAEEFSKTWTTNGQQAFDLFLKGLQSMSANGQNLDTVLRGIGLKNVRDIQTIQKLGDNYDVYAEAIRNANSAYGEGTFLSDSYAKIQDTVAAKLELLQNNFNNLMATLGEGATGDFFKGFLDAINNALTGLNNFMRSPLAQAVMPWVMALTALVGAVAALNTVIALAKAASLAYGTAMGIASVQTKVLADGTKVMTTSIKASTVAMNAFKTAAKAFLPMLAISAAIEAFAALAEAMAPIEQKAESILGGFAGLQDAITGDLQAYNDALEATGGDVSQAKEAAGIFYEVAAAQSDAATEAQKNAQAQQDLKTITNLLSDDIASTSENVETLNVMLGKNTAEWIRNAIYQSATFQALAQNSAAMDAIVQSGFNVDAALQAVADGNLDGYMDDVTTSAIGAASGFEQWTYEMLKNGGVIGWILTLIPRLLNSITSLFGLNLFPVTSGLEDLKNSIKGAVNQSALLGPNINSLANQLNTIKNPFAEINTDLDKTNKKVKTVVDYASDLAGLFKRIDDINFSREIAVDDIASGWKAIRDSAADAAKAIKKASDAKKELEATKTTLEYQLKVAERYGDTRRAEIIRAKLAENTTSLADANKDLTDAQAAQNKSLTDNTQASIANKSGLLDMLGKYQSYIQALASTGMKQDELEGNIATLKQEFINEGVAIGYNRGELDKYAGQFDLYAKAVDKTPRDITVKFDAKKDAAFNAIQEYLAKEHTLTVNVKTNGSVPTVSGGSIGGGLNSSGSTTAPKSNAVTTPKTAPKVTKAMPLYISSMDPRYANRIKDPNYLTLSADKINASRSGKPVPTAADVAGYHKLIDDKAWENVVWGRKDWFEQLRDGIAHNRILDELNDKIIQFETKFGSAYASGGYVSGAGTSTSDSIPAMLSNGEFVINARATKMYGTDFMNALNQMRVGTAMPGGAGSGASGSSSQVVYLSPDDRALLRAAVNRPVNLYSENSKIASSADAGNIVLAQRGLN